ncbi:MAG: NAD(P)/FAD-dependent oxidoreductase, partial [bacterium]|nr:NAD(P)/FAD-dependent oxidoreductase [bacterium]
YGIGDTLDDFEKIGVKTYVQEDLRIFPEENKASFVRKKLLEALNGKIKFVNTEIKNFPQGFDAVILATGLKSGALLPQSIGHKIIPLKSSLCGLKIREKEFLALEGVSFNGVVFTKDGVSGPFIYKLSSINAYKEFPYEIKIPLLDTKELVKKTAENPKKLFKNVVSEFIPKSLADLIVKSDKQCANTSKKEIEEISFLALTAEDIDGRGEIVHAGGVSLDEVDRNLKSKIKENLWIIGEVLDTDGFTGGFNLQNCWSTAAIAAKDIAEKFKG